MCPRGSNYSLQASLRRMNQHRKNCHTDQGYLSSEAFLSLECVQAVQTGIKKSYVEKADKPSKNDFRSESLFESTVGLLKSCIYFDQEEESCIVDSSLFVASGHRAQKALWDDIFQDVERLFARTDLLCRQAGSTMVRHQMMRNEENIVSSKVFHPVTAITAKRYARHVCNNAFTFMRHVNYSVTQIASGCRLCVLLRKSIRTECSTYRHFCSIVRCSLRRKRVHFTNIQSEVMKLHVAECQMFTLNPFLGNSFKCLINILDAVRSPEVLNWSSISVFTFYTHCAAYS